PPQPPPTLSAEHRERWDRIARRAVEIERQDYFTMLGVTRDASAQTVGATYLELARSWHPDTLPAALAALRPWMERIFHHLTRARDTLVDENRRREYLRTLQDGGGTPEADRLANRLLQAALEFQKVEVLLRRRAWDEALALLDGIRAVAPDEAEYLAAEAWARFQKAPTDEAVARRALDLLDAALKRSPKLAVAHHRRGCVLERLGREAEAIEAFRRAAELDPHDLDAARRVRLAEMRASRTAGKPAAGGLISKLLGSDRKK
ncbi:MAG: DnaJ domain-containing protein, partial [Myxococcota bacterium]|nr:DnaJ domain-containing protein [Myxococcota bacterium]